MIPCSASILHVDDDALAGGDGSSWDNAFRFLQDALVAAASDPNVSVIRTAGGTYTPDRDEAGIILPLDRAATFQMLDNLIILGGYRGLDGIGWQQDLRVPESFETILSGDLAGDDVGDPDDPSYAENSFHVVTSSGTNSSAVLDGVTIRGGFANGDVQANRLGGGIYNVLGSPVIRQCRFEQNGAGDTTETRNYSDGGGAIYNGVESAPLIDSCVFDNNWILGSGTGAAVWNHIDSNPSIISCLFENHPGQDASYSKTVVSNWGAAGSLIRDCTFRYNQVRSIWNVSGGYSTIQRCTFLDNVAPGTIHGGAIRHRNTNGVITECQFLGNGAEFGGAISISPASRLVITSSVFSGNHARNSGGAISSGSFALEVVNCSFSRNSAALWVGGLNSANGVAPTIWNSVFWGNSDLRGEEKFSQYTWGGLSPQISFSLIQGWDEPPGESGNYNLDPQFEDPDGPDNIPGTLDDDLHLKSSSFAINQGHSLAPNVPSVDMEGDERIQSCRVDIGADESRFNGGYQDCNGNWTDDNCDLLNGTSLDCALNYIPDECELDCDNDGITDACELDGGAPDCNENGFPDECDVSDGIEDDCDANGVLDSCEARTIVLDEKFSGFRLDTSQWSTGSPDSRDYAVSNGFLDLERGGRVASTSHDLRGAGDTRITFLHDPGVFGASGELHISYWDGEFWRTFHRVPVTSSVVWLSSSAAFPEQGKIQNARIRIRNASSSFWWVDNVVWRHDRPDCNLNNQRDDCDILDMTEGDCNANKKPDSCDISDGLSHDFDGMGTPDECQSFGDTNDNGILDLEDMFGLVQCLNGPIVSPNPSLPYNPTVCREFFDGDENYYVDLLDLALLQNEFLKFD